MIVVIKKNQIILCLVLFFAVVLAYSVSDKANVAVNQRNVYGKLSNKVVVIDPGHGGIDPGKTGINGDHEKDINLAISQFLKKYLEKSGAVVVMTRTKDEGLYDKNRKMRVREQKRQDLKRRTEYAMRKDTNVFVSIHQNALPPSQSKYYGAQTFYYQGSEQGESLAKNIQQSLINGIDNGNKREIKATKEYYILRNTSVPAVIVECGFISNYNEEKILNTKEYQKKIAKCISKGIEDYLCNKN
jgi:N-acetylmuramoyl-L-alanine amidase